MEVRLIRLLGIGLGRTTSADRSVGAFELTEVRKQPRNSWVIIGVSRIVSRYFVAV